MKKIKWWHILLVIIVGFNLSIVLTGKYYIYKTLRYNFAGIDDYKIFDNKTIHANNYQPWAISKNYNKKQLSNKLQSKLKELKSIAFLIIQNDSIQYEEYWDGYSDSSYSNSFSMAKTIVSIMTGIAIKEGYIKDVNQPVSDFLPSFAKGEKAKITIKHLLTMSSGLDWTESYINPYANVTEAYYGKNLKALIDKLEVNVEPGTEWRYKSGDTQVLCFLLEKATGMKLATYTEKRLWNKIGAQHDALWSTDYKDGYVKSYCCFNSNARDFARIGKLYLNNGMWLGQRLINSDYIKNSIQKPQIGNKIIDHYGYQWWLIKHKGEQIYYARGILGQYIIMVPSKNAIIVRLGHKRGAKMGNHYEEIPLMIDEVLDEY